MVVHGMTRVRYSSAAQFTNCSMSTWRVVYQLLLGMDRWDGLEDGAKIH